MGSPLGMPATGSPKTHFDAFTGFRTHLVETFSVVYVQCNAMVWNILQGGPKKTAHGVCVNNFVNSQQFFIIFGTRTL